MQVDLTPLLRARGREHALELRFVLPVGPTPLGDRLWLDQPAEVRVTVEGGPREVDVAVAADLQLLCPCDRCLDAVRTPLAVAYEERWRLTAAAGDGRAVPDDDGDESVLAQAGPLVDLDNGFWQNASLELPTKVLCAEGCRGLCPYCGTNRNRTACACREEPDAGPMAALAQWRPRP